MFPGGSTGGTAIDLQVTAAGGLSVNANAGMCQVGRDSNGPYYAGLTAAVTVTHGTANASNPRVDIVVLRTRDPGVDSTVTESARLTVLPGTAAAVPSAPTGSVTSGDIVLAYVTVRANSSSIAGSDIEDRRTFVAARGGIAPQSAADSKSGSYPGQYKDNGQLLRWSGSAWEPVASPAVWSTWSAPLNSPGGVVNLGSSATYACRYLRTGKRGDLSYTWTANGTGANVRTGAITSLLPPGWVSRGLGSTDLMATLYNAPQSGNNVAEFLMLGNCVVLANDNVLRFRFPFSGNTSLRGQFIGSAGTGVGSGTPTVPNGYWGGPGSVLSVTGVIELQ